MAEDFTYHITHSDWAAKVAKTLCQGFLRKKSPKLRGLNVSLSDLPAQSECVIRYAPKTVQRSPNTSVGI